MFPGGVRLVRPPGWIRLQQVVFRMEPQICRSGAHPSARCHVYATGRFPTGDQYEIVGVTSDIVQLALSWM